jgi:hypothetical protein
MKKLFCRGGKDKDYKMNESYDYFEIAHENKEVRKKVIPQLDGVFNQ